MREEGGSFVDCFVYRSENNARFKGKNESHIAIANHWASYSASGNVEVRVTSLLDILPKQVTIRPKKANLKATIEGDSTLFTITEPGHYSIEINQDGNRIEHPLLIFANPPEKNRPNLKDPKTWNVAKQGLPPTDRKKPLTIYFPRGVHHLVRDHGVAMRPGFILKSNEYLYLAPGAYVIGAFDSDANSENIRISGRGILSGLGEPFVKSKYRPMNHKAKETFSYHLHQEHLMKLSGRNHHVEGITFADPVHFTLNVGKQCTIEWVKCFGWHYSTDGIGLDEGSTARHCFLKVNDDSFKLYDNHLEISDCVIWQQFNGGAFQFGWGPMAVEKGLTVRNIDIIHDEHRGDANNRGLFSCVELNRAVKRNLVFEDIRIEGNSYRLFDLRVQKGGLIENLVVRRLHLEGEVTDASYLRERGGEFGAIIFENCTVNGTALTSPDQIKLRLEGDIDPSTFRIKP